MNAALGENIVPALRARGFTGSLPHFRRFAPARTDLLTFQFDRYGGGFVIEMAEAPPGDFVTKWGKVIPARRLTALNINPPARKRLRPGSGGSTDHWFRYDREASCEVVAQSLIAFLPQIDAWFSGAKDQPNVR